MNKTLIAPLFAILTLSACGKTDTPAPSPPPAPTPAPVVQATPAPPAMEAPATTPEPATAPTAEAPTPAPAETGSASAAASAMGSGDTYVVARGDTLYGIAKAHSVAVNDLAKWNDISDPAMLHVGKELHLSAGK